MLTPEQQKQLQALGITRAQQARLNPQARTILGEELYNDITKDLDKNPDVDFVLGLADGAGNTAGGNTPAVTRAKAVAASVGGGNTAAKKYDPIPLVKSLEASLGIIGNNSLKAPQETGFQDPLELHSPVYGDLQTRSMYNNMASKIRRKVNTPISSDPALQAARQIEGEVQANDSTAKGWQADSNMIKQTSDRSLGLGIESARSRKAAHDFNVEKNSRNNVAA
jgi:hypothetical protein